jgi:hypothetical protein
MNCLGKMLLNMPSFMTLLARNEPQDERTYPLMPPKTLPTSVIPKWPLTQALDEAESLAWCKSGFVEEPEQIEMLTRNDRLDTFHLQGLEIDA